MPSSALSYSLALPVIAHESDGILDDLKRVTRSFKVVRAGSRRWVVMIAIA
jgi:hypothetical protein